MTALIQGVVFGLLLLLVCNLHVSSWRWWVMMLAIVAYGIFEHERGLRGRP